MAMVSGGAAALSLSTLGAIQAEATHKSCETNFARE
jgi:hypothetical protein